MLSFATSRDLAPYRKALKNSLVIREFLSSLRQTIKDLGSNGEEVFYIPLITIPEDEKLLTETPRALYWTVIIYTHISLKDNFYFALSDSPEGLREQLTHIRPIRPYLTCNKRSLLLGKHPEGVGGVRCYIPTTEGEPLLYSPFSLRSNNIARPLTLEIYREELYDHYNLAKKDDYRRMTLKETEKLITTKSGFFKTQGACVFLSEMIEATEGKIRVDKVTRIFKLKSLWKREENDKIIASIVAKTGDLNLLQITLETLKKVRKVTRLSKEILWGAYREAILYNHMIIFITLSKEVESSFYDEKFFLEVVRNNQLSFLSNLVQWGINIEPYLSKGILLAHEEGHSELRELLERVKKGYENLKGP